MHLTNFHFLSRYIGTKNYLYSKPVKGLRACGVGYGFGFNGKENDNETKTQDYGMRIYDYRLGKFLSVDPLSNEFPELTPYQFASNTPIMAIDLDGLEAWFNENGDVTQRQTLNTKYPISIVNYNSPKIGFGPYSLNYAASMGLSPNPSVQLPTMIVGKNSTHVDVKSGHQDAYSPSTDIYAGMSFIEGTLKTSGVICTVVGFPEVGLPLYAWGDAVDDVKSVMTVLDAAVESDKSKATIQIVGKVAETTLQQWFKKVGKLGGVDDYQQFGSEVFIDQSIDMFKDLAEDADKPEEKK